MKNVSLGIVIAALAVSAPRLTLAFLIGDGIHIPESIEITILAVTGVGSGIVLTVGNAVLAHALAAKAQQRGPLWWLNALAWLLFLLGAVVLVAPTLVAGLHRSTLATVLNTPNARWVWSVVAVVVIELLVGAAMAAAILADETRPPSVRRGPSRWGRLLDAATARAVHALESGAPSRPDANGLDRPSGSNGSEPQRPDADDTARRDGRPDMRSNRTGISSGSEPSEPQRPDADRPHRWDGRSDMRPDGPNVPSGLGGFASYRLDADGAHGQRGRPDRPSRSDGFEPQRPDADAAHRQGERPDARPDLSPSSNGTADGPAHADGLHYVGRHPDADDAEAAVSGPPPNANRTRARTKKEALEHCLHVWRTNPRASLAEVGQVIGRRKSTVGEYRQELERQQRIRIDAHGSVVVLQPS